MTVHRNKNKTNRPILSYSHPLVTENKAIQKIEKVGGGGGGYKTNGNII